MADKRIIAVVGATGSQGGGLVRAILNDKSGQFQPRALTRNSHLEKAKTLAAMGAQIVEADLNNVETLIKAFEGAYGVYCVTNYWEHFSPEKEIANAEAMAKASKHAGVQHVIWSTLEDTRQWIPLSDNRMPTLMGKYKTPHFDAKGESNHFFTDLGVPTTFLLTSFYWDNFINFGMGPKKNPDGGYAITLPLGDKKLAGIAAEDIGKCAFGILNDRQTIGKTLGISGDQLTGEQIASAMTIALGKEICYSPIAPAAYRALGFPGAEDLGNMFQFYMEVEKYFCERRDIQATRALNPELLSFDGWLAQYKKQIVLGAAQK
jgi:uncharacterized protein YbjT (DUF2867 family)